MRNRIQILLLLASQFLFVAQLYSQSISIKLKDLEPRYSSITKVVVNSELATDEKTDYLLRIIVTGSEIYSQIFIEKISLKEENFTDEVLSSKFINLLPLYLDYAISTETARIGEISWKASDQFSIEIDKITFLAEVYLDKNEIRFSKQK